MQISEIMYMKFGVQFFGQFKLRYEKVAEKEFQESEIFNVFQHRQIKQYCHLVATLMYLNIEITKNNFTILVRNE